MLNQNSYTFEVSRVATNGVSIRPLFKGNNVLPYVGIVYYSKKQLRDSIDLLECAIEKAGIPFSRFAPVFPQALIDAETVLD